MAQMTGTQIVATARVFAQDTSTAGPAVSDANALVLLNDVLLRFAEDVDTKSALLDATSSGLTYAANAAVAATNASDFYDHIVAAYPSDTAAVNTILTPALQHWTVDQMLEAYQDSGDGSVTGSGTREWQAYAWERVGSGAADTGLTVMRVYVYPALSATRYLTIRVARNTLLAALTGTPDLSQREARIVARLLAWEMARLHARDEAFLGQILAPIPEEVLNAYYQSAKRASRSQSAPKDTGWSNG